MTATAEGVESEEQAAMLREFGCPQVQGFLYGQPGSPDAASNGRAKVTPIKPRSSAAPVAVTAGSWTVSLWRSRHWARAPSAPLQTAT